MSLLLSVLLQVCSTSNNANSNKRVILFSGITWYYSDNVRTFDFIVRSDACTWLVVPDTDSCVTYNTDMDSHVTCSKKYPFFISCVQLQGFSIDSHTLAWVRCMIMVLPGMLLYQAWYLQTSSCSWLGSNPFDSHLENEDCENEDCENEDCENEESNFTCTRLKQQTMKMDLQQHWIQVR